MPASLRVLTMAIAGFAVLFLACDDDGPTSLVGGSSKNSIPYLTIGGGADERGFAARRTPDGGYLIVGLIGKPRGFFNDLHAVRTDANGAIVGQYPVRRGETHANIHASVLTADGGIVAITTRSSVAILIKFASDGSVAWERDYGTRTGPAMYSLCTAGDGFLITILPDVFADLNTVEFIFANADGTVRLTDQWPDSPRRIFSAAEAADGSFILAGSRWTTPTNLDIFVARTKPGVIEESWARTIGGQDYDHAAQVITLNNDAVMFGIMDDPPGHEESGFYYLMRLRPGGGTAWTRDVTGMGYIYDMTATSHDGLAVAGRDPVDGAKIANLHGNGSVIWERTVGSGAGDEGVYSIVADPGGFVVTGIARTEESPDIDILLARTDLLGIGYPFPPHEPVCIDPVTPPKPSDVVGTQRSYSVVHNTGLGIEAIWAMSSDFVIAVGDSGHIARFDGTSWSQMTSNTREELFDVYGFAEDDVFVAARHGKIFHYDGVSWSEMPSTATYLSSLWGAAPDDIWAGGVQLMHYDGARWTDETPKGWRTPIDMDGITATDIYSAGAAGMVQHFDGCTWSTVYEAPDQIYGISAIPGPLVHGAGDNGLVVRYTQGVWQTFNLPTNPDFTSVWARSKNDVFIGGTSGFAGPYVLYWFDGSSWTMQPQASTQALLDLTGTTDGHIFGATTYNYIVQGTP